MGRAEQIGPRGVGRHAALVGATASGKSALALAIAHQQRDVELVSVDSMQVYRGMDIGTAKPSPAEQADVPHHLIDLVDPWDEFTVARFRREAVEVIDDIERRGRRALLVGGTGLYLQALVDDLDIPPRFPEARAAVEAEPDTTALHARLVSLDPTAASRMEPTNRRRIVRALEVCLGSGRPFSSFGPGVDRYPDTPFLLLGIGLPREVIDARIDERYEQQLAHGFVDEVKRLSAAPDGLSATARQALGYRELLGHVEGGVPLGEAVDQAKARTRQFARRQERWFRRDPRIRWHDAEDNPIALLPSLLRDWPPCS